MSFLRASLTVGSFTLLSRVLGFVRDVLTAAFLGAGPIADAFFVALKLPNFFRRITAEGAFSVSFIPIFSRSLKSESEEKALHFAGRALSIMLIILISFTLMAVVFMPYLINLIAPGFEGDPLRFEIAVTLSRITFGYLVFMSIVALLGGVLNSYDIFYPFAAAPILFNLSLISSLLFLTHFTQTPAHAMAYGVFAAGVLQLIWLSYSIKRARIKIKLQKPDFSPKILKLFRLMGPGILGAGVVQINVFVDMILASFLPTGAVSYLYYADRLNQLPLGVIGIAIGTALLPKLSKAINGNEGEKKQANRLFNQALIYSFLLALPAAIALAIIPNVLIEALFERGAFGFEASQATAMALFAYALGLPAFVGIKVFGNSFYAYEDTKTPVKIAALGAVINIILSLIFIQYFAHVGIALATSLAAWSQMLFYGFALKPYQDIFVTRQTWIKMIQIISSALIMGTILYCANGFLSHYLNKILLLVALVVIGKAVYSVSLIVMRVITLKEIKTLLKG